jgi:hypothetical protein
MSLTVFFMQNSMMKINSPAFSRQIFSPTSLIFSAILRRTILGDQPEEKYWEINLKELLSYSLSDYPLSIATVTGCLVKISKANILHILEEAANNPTVDIMNIGDNNALIVDAMAVLQALKWKWKTFGEFADSIFHYLVKLARQCKLIDLTLLLTGTLQ